jgi:NAD(P)-dependent dehydrogenase (short-subunit alcohol dehydrogenase family)
MAASAMTEPRRHAAPVFAGVQYHSLRDARVLLTGGAGGIGADIAPMVLFLAADTARMITAQEFVVDGGWT